MRSLEDHQERHDQSFPNPQKMIWKVPAGMRCAFASRLFESQPDGSQLTYQNCKWAADFSAKELGRRPTMKDFDRLGSHLSTPLWLLASAHSERNRRWTKQQRIDAAYQLLRLLLAERW